MKKKYWIIAVIILIGGMITLGTFFYFQKNEKKENDSLTLYGSNTLVEQLSKKYEITYKKETVKTKESKLIYKNNTLTSFTEYEIINFFIEQKLIKREMIEKEYLSEIDFSKMLTLILKEESQEKSLQNKMIQLEAEKQITYNTIFLEKQSDTVKKLLQEKLKWNAEHHFYLSIKKENKEVYQTTSKISVEELEQILIGKEILEKIGENNTPSSPKETTKPSSSPTNKTPKPTSTQPPKKPEATKTPIPSPSSPTSTPVPTPTKPAETPNLPTNYYTKINASTFQTLIHSSEKKIIIAGQTGCGYCKEAIPNLQKIASNKKIKIYYLDMKEAGNEKILWTSGLANVPNRIGTPYAMIISNKTVLDAIQQKYLESDYLNFFQKNGLL